MVKKTMKKRVVAEKMARTEDDLAFNMHEYFFMGLSFLVIATAAYYVVNVL